MTPWTHTTFPFLFREKRTFHVYRAKVKLFLTCAGIYEKKIMSTQTSTEIQQLCHFDSLGFEPKVTLWHTVVLTARPCLSHTFRLIYQGICPAATFDVFVPKYALAVTKTKSQTQILICAPESTQKTTLTDIISSAESNFYFSTTFWGSNHRPYDNSIFEHWFEPTRLQAQTQDVPGCF